MRRFLRILSRFALVVLAIAFVFLLAGYTIHLLQLSHLHRLASTSARDYIVENSPYFVLANARVIDGTGSEERTEQNIVVRDHKIVWIGSTSEMPIQPGAKFTDLSGATVIPGLVMMHEHLFTSSPSMGPRLSQQSTAFPLLYLALGVTSARTAGSLDPDSDLQVKQKIDAGAMVGPELFLTAPYLEGTPLLFPQMHSLAGPDDAKSAVDKYSAKGFTSFKAYTDITPAELQAAITEAHLKSAKITGHLCTVTFTQAADMGIDNLEHGLLVDTEFFSGKTPNKCPSTGTYLTEYANRLDLESPEVQGAIDHLVAHHVAITSTLAVFEGELGAQVPAWYHEHEERALTWQSWFFARTKQKLGRRFLPVGLLSKEQHFELDFARHGGTLLAGSDPTGDGSVLAGFADLREIELLVQAGFSPSQAIEIATKNGADFLGIANRTGTLAVGKQADLVVIDGDCTQNIENIRNVRTVYKGGVGYDSRKMINAVVGVIGLTD